jgi:hypothetical protein
MNRFRSVPALAGLGFAATVVVELVAFPGGASSADPPAAIAGYYAQHGGSDLVADHLSLLATPLLVAFFCGATARLTGTAQRFAQSVVTAAAGFELVATAIEMSLAATVRAPDSPAAPAAVYQVAPRLFFFGLLFLGLAIGTVTAAAPARPWQRWLGAVTTAVLIGAGLAAAHPHGALGVLILPAELLLVGWVVAAAVVQLRRHTSPAAREASPVSAAEPPLPGVARAGGGPTL